MAKIAGIRRPDFDDVDIDIPDFDRSKDGMLDFWGLRGRDDHDRALMTPTRPPYEQAIVTHLFWALPA